MYCRACGFDDTMTITKFIVVDADALVQRVNRCPLNGSGGYLEQVRDQAEVAACPNCGTLRLCADFIGSVQYE